VSDMLRLMGICPGDTVVLEAEVEAMKAYQSMGLGYCPRKWRVVSIQEGIALLELIAWPDNKLYVVAGRQICLESEMG